MEINKFSDIRGVIPNQDIPEGRMVLVEDHGFSYDFGSREDLVGVKLPADSTEAGRARYVVAFAVDNRSVPIYQEIPSFESALRYGFDKPSNVPFSAVVHLTPPGNKLGGVIPSGNPALAFAGGEYTVQSDGFLDNAGLLPDAYLIAANTNDDGAANAGKLKYSASATGAIARVVRKDAVKGTLTFRTLVP